MHYIYSWYAVQGWSKKWKVLLFGDELRVKAGENSELTVRVDMFYILEQADWVKK